MEIVNYILDPGPMDLTGIGDEYGVREAAREHAIRSGMPGEFAVTYAQGRVDAFDQMKGSWSNALAFADGYEAAIRIRPRQKDEEAILTVAGQQASVQFQLLRQPDLTVAFKNGFRQARSCVNSEHHPRPAQAYAYGYAEGLRRFPLPPNPNHELHHAERLREVAESLGKQAG